MAVQLSVTGHCEAIGCAYPSLRLCGGVVVRGGGYYFIRVDEDSERDVDKDERVEVEMEGTSREGTVWARGRSSQCVKELVERGQLDLRVWWCYSRTELPSLACLARSPGQAASGPPPIIPLSTATPCQSDGAMRLARTAPCNSVPVCPELLNLRPPLVGVTLRSAGPLRSAHPSWPATRYFASTCGGHSASPSAAPRTALNTHRLAILAHVGCGRNWAGPQHKLCLSRLSQ